MFIVLKTEKQCITFLLAAHAQNWLLNGLDHHACCLSRVGLRGFPGEPVEASCPSTIISLWVPISMQVSWATATEPPSSTFFSATVINRNIPKNAWGAAIIVTVICTETIAILVNASICPTDRITLGWEKEVFTKLLKGILFKYLVQSKLLDPVHTLLIWIILNVFVCLVGCLLSQYIWNTIYIM